MYECACDVRVMYECVCDVRVMYECACDVRVCVHVNMWLFITS